jgi:hypothetical protein
MKRRIQLLSMIMEGDPSGTTPQPMAPANRRDASKRLAHQYCGLTLVQKSVNSMVSKKAITSTIFPPRICMYQV